MAEAFKSQRRVDQASGLLPGYVRHFRIFLSSPGDVPAERKIALEVIAQLQYEPHGGGDVSGGSSGLRDVGYERGRLGMDAHRARERKKQ